MPRMSLLGFSLESLSEKFTISFSSLNKIMGLGNEEMCSISIFWIFFISAYLAVYKMFTIHPWLWESSHGYGGRCVWEARSQC